MAAAIQEVAPSNHISKGINANITKKPNCLCFAFGFHIIVHCIEKTICFQCIATITFIMIWKILKSFRTERGGGVFVEHSCYIYENWCSHDMNIWCSIDECGNLRHRGVTISTDWLSCRHKHSLSHRHTHTNINTHMHQSTKSKQKTTVFTKHHQDETPESEVSAQ